MDGPDTTDAARADDRSDPNAAATCGPGGQSDSVNAAAFRAAEDDVFARIADRYDALCDVFSLRLHRSWKRAMAARIVACDAAIALDVASGTGDIPARVLRSGREPAVFWVTDVSPQMLTIARRKLAGATGDIRFALYDGERLDQVADNSVDLYSISFGMKICDRRRVIGEALRVLKPGGSFFCLEASQIVSPGVHRAYLAYMDWCLPLIGRLAARGDASAYAYLLRGLREFPGQEAWADEIRAAGFADVAYENLTFGIVALHTARKPS